ncbi:MAG: hypothetical protein H7326_08470 [Bdellovibrionaceae bacterium]|nr:hypothetical protein [Pseudobdellovibrionaceae bacterium]
MELQSDTFELSPPVVLQKMKIANATCYIAREDLLEGGTKQRAIAPYLEDLVRAGYTHFIYASPFCGFAQVALAASARQLGLKVTIFSEHDPKQSDATSNPHAFTQIAADFGAEIRLFRDLNSAELAAAEFARLHGRRYKIPLGFADASYLVHMKQKLSEQYRIICKAIGTPKRFWLPVGSGTLARIFAEVVPSTCQLVCVDVRVLRPDDPRLHFVADMPNVKWIQTPELFHETAEMKPALPSNVHYDAKLWRFFASQAQDGDIWWNVAR